jgi:hypothetical protein
MMLKLYLTWLVKDTVSNVVEDGVDAATDGTEVDGVVTSDMIYANDETVVQAMFGFWGILSILLMVYSLVVSINSKGLHIVR